MDFESTMDLNSAVAQLLTDFGERPSTNEYDENKMYQYQVPTFDTEFDLEFECEAVVTTNDVEIEEIELEDQETERNNHHSGKIPIRYISDKRKRCITYAKRVKTLTKLARELHVLTGAEAEIYSKNEFGRVKYYNSKMDKKQRNVGIQYGPSFVSKTLPATRSKTLNNLTPTKQKEIEKPSTSKVYKLPGKKSKRK